MRAANYSNRCDAMIYADNAATTRLDPNAFEAMKPFLLENYGNASQAYAFSRVPKKALRESRAMIAACIGACAEEIYFTSGGTESDNWAIKGAAQYTEKPAIITSVIEHHAILRSCEAMERQGVPLIYLHPLPDGRITPDILADAITENTTLVSVMLANNEIGTIQPIAELCEAAHKKGALFHTDAVQAVGHIPIHVHEMDVDLLSASAHKFNGPKGVGFLYVKKGVKISPYMNGGAQESGMRAGTENVAGIVGMAVALKNNCDAMKENESHLTRLESKLLDILDMAGISYVRNGAVKKLPGLLSLSFPNEDGEALLHRLDLAGICVSTGAACDSKSTVISHVLKAIGLQEEYAKGTIRISLGKWNTEEDVEGIAHALKKCLL